MAYSKDQYQTQAVMKSAVLDEAFSNKIEGVCQALNVDPARGLSSTEAQKRLEKYGENKLGREKKKSILLIFIEQFLDPVIYVLGVAALLGFIFGETIEGIAVLIVIAITSLIGFVMEWRAHQSMSELLELVESQSMIIRDGLEVILDDDQIVPGDILLLEVGEVVPCDGRILSHEGLAIKESILTGESSQVEKSEEILSSTTQLSDRTNMVFAGTLVTRGKGKAVAIATGDRTELGKISLLSREASKQITPIEKRLKILSKQLIWLTIGLAIFIIGVGIIQGREVVQMIETAFALAVAAIPEGLPIVATIALVRGMLRLAKDRAIIKNLSAVETLGNVSIICTDKTGTLTENEMTAKTILLHDKNITIPDSGVQPVSRHLKENKAFNLIIQSGVLCSNAEFDKKKGKYIGDPIEIGLLQLAEKYGYEIDNIRKEFIESLELPFDTSTKMMATINQNESGYIVNVKGALENILPYCDSVYVNDGPPESLNKAKWLSQIGKLASKGYRILAFAFKNVERMPDNKEIFQRLKFLGIIAFFDPPRQDVKSAIKTCQKAGIQVVMITGDHAGTAQNIAKEVGLIDLDNHDQVILGKDIPSQPNISSEELNKILRTKVFARVTPTQKLNLVTLFQKNNLVVGMTGDGVNDAPALKKADIGIAMGIRGTEAAKEAADLILRDDQFSSIELTIQQGRIIFENIRKFITYLLSSNLAEIISVAVASLGGLPLPLLPLQILYLNLVTDIFPALSLALGEGEANIMDQKPRQSDEPILSKKLWISTIIYGFGIAVAVIAISIFALYHLKLGPSEVNNMAFYTLVLAQLLNVFNLPIRTISFFNNEVTRNPWIWVSILLCIFLTLIGYWVEPLQIALNLVELNINQVGWIVLFSFGSLFFTQIIKRLGGTV